MASPASNGSDCTVQLYLYTLQQARPLLVVTAQKDTLPLMPCSKAVDFLREFGPPIVRSGYLQNGVAFNASHEGQTFRAVVPDTAQGAAARINFFMNKDNLPQNETK